MENEYFGIVRWCDDDIRAALAYRHASVTEERFDAIKRRLEHHSFKDHMIAAGWDFIDTVISDELDS